MTCILAGLGGREHEFGVVEVVDRTIAPNEHVQRRPLLPSRIFTLVIVVIGVRGGRKQSEIPPAALLGERAYPLKGRFGDNHEIQSIRDMRRGPIETVQNGST